MLLRTCILFALFLAVPPALPAQEFKSDQLRYGRVREAYREKGSLVRSLISANALDSNTLTILIRAFKQEHLLEVWGSDSLNEEYVLLKEYRICRVCGEPGPKRRQGDKQVPEGIYHINRFNPWSSFHLSLGINYPNASDRRLADRRHPGGEIYIHGACVTIGCLPMTDERIKEIYILAVEARNNGQEEIPVHIFPCRMEGEIYENLTENHRHEEALLGFWNNLQEAYLYFKMNKYPPEFTVESDGSYCIH
jgi:murein L,D-transpeptidase YafK